jgi:hypothetical protein
MPMSVKKITKMINVILRTEGSQQLLEMLGNFSDTTIEECEDEVFRTETYSPFLENHAKAYMNFGNFYETNYRDLFRGFICRTIGEHIFYLKNNVDRKVTPAEGIISPPAIEEANFLLGLANLLCKLSFRRAAVVLLNRAISVLNNNVSEGQSAIVSAKLDLIRIYTFLEEYENAWMLLNGLKKTDILESFYFDYKKISLICREARLLHKENKSNEAINLLRLSFEKCENDLHSSMLYEAIVYIETEIKNYSQALKDAIELKAIFDKTLSSNLNDGFIRGSYPFDRVKILNGIVEEQFEKEILDYIAYLKKQYIPAFPSDQSDKTWSLLKHDAIVFSMDFSKYDDFHPLKSVRKTDFVRIYNFLCNEQNNKNATSTEHEYSLLEGNKKYSAKDIFKLAMDYWIICYRPDDEDLIDAYETMIKLYALMDNHEKVGEFAKIIDTAKYDGKLIKDILSEREKYIFLPLIIRQTNIMEV